MKTLLVIGMGAGNSDHLTMQAVAALARVDVVFVIDKGTAPELLAVRDEILRRHASGSHRVVTIPDAERDREADDYQGAVARWHHQRAERIAGAVDQFLAAGEVGAFLVWGDPSLYDSTLRIIDQIRDEGLVDLEHEVVPGISSVQLLAAAHRVPLHGIGAPVHITTGRRLADEWDPDRSTVVMLDGQLAFTGIDPTGIEILWGAYLGTPDQRLVRGDLAVVADRIVAERKAGRDRHGWIMDTYLLRRHPPE